MKIRVNLIEYEVNGTDLFIPIAIAITYITYLGGDMQCRTII